MNKRKFYIYQLRGMSDTAFASEDPMLQSTDTERGEQYEVVSIVRARNEYEALDVHYTHGE